jgi:hypothetical protein
MIPSGLLTINTKPALFAFVITILSACNNNSGTDPDFNYNKIANKGDSVKNNTQLLVPQGQTNVIPAAAAANPGATTGAVNPAHGQPGHRCEIAVGAPLNSTPPTTPVEQKQPQTITTQTTTAPVVAAKTTASAGMNPAHGQPGHRCDIAVGAPLNSKPVTPAAPQQTTAATTKTVTAPGMNPPHGEPGHRCDIGVGTPLSQPVKTNTEKTVSPVVKDTTKN